MLLIRTEPIDRGPDPEDGDEDDETWAWPRDEAFVANLYLHRMGSRAI
jgi:hypothetical protein